MDAVREVGLLGLRLARLQPRLLAGWSGPPALAEQVAAAPLPSPVRLAAAAGELADRLWSADLDAGVRERLAAVLEAVRTHAAVLAGERIGYVEEVRRCYQVTPALQPAEDYVHAKDRLATLLPGAGPLANRLAAHRTRTACPPQRLGEVAAVLTDALREQVPVPLPDGERVRLHAAPGQWNGFGCREGTLTTSVTISTTQPMPLARLAQLVAHETYPGHHLVRLRRPADGGLDLLGTPLSVTEEGLAENGLPALIGPDWGPWLQRLLAPLGIEVDGAHLQAVHEAAAPLGAARADAALMLHDRGAGAEEVTRHLTGWALSTPTAARRVLDFLADPLWSRYIWAPVAGAPLVARWLAADLAGTAPDRLVSLLGDPRTPDRLRSVTPPVTRSGNEPADSRVVARTASLPG